MQFTPTIVTLGFSGLAGGRLAWMYPTGEYCVHPFSFLTLYLNRYNLPMSTLESTILVRVKSLVSKPV
jgi:hypothetical protein